MLSARKTLAIAAAFVGAVVALSGCASNNPLDEPTKGTAGGDAATIVVGSQSYPSNETIAEIYAQALEGAGMKVDRKFSIGQRDAYMPALESGEIQVFPEYTGNLLQFLDKDATATAPDDVYAALKDALPDSLAVLDMATATDQDSYTVTKAFADKYQLTSIADLANVTEKLTLGGNPELADRPYGPKGLKSIYGIDIGFKGTGDTTVEDLVAGTVNVADVYTSDPRIQTDDLVVLNDPKGMILASNVVPVVSTTVQDKVADVLNAVQAKLTPEALVDMNVQNTVDKKSSADIAKAFLSDNGLN
ncbi:ABC transporter substrate-binding protein [Microbacterium protaetiae]|uniref:ABC transporter substrate-binding protein n=1 Tax=Microbacterium protaetiae TaxID=2509458 RepID=A0A4P6EHA1_9MICO|nr:ABC transporter substrate-binding protein [Microbacterium protaetiae]QAY60873.1 ABC transporter substrate-binding protein [Microbacterium protaetiae]